VSSAKVLPPLAEGFLYRYLHSDKSGLFFDTCTVTPVQPVVQITGNMSAGNADCTTTAYDGYLLMFNCPEDFHTAELSITVLNAMSPILYGFSFAQTAWNGTAVPRATCLNLILSPQIASRLDIVGRNSIDVTQPLLDACGGARSKRAEPVTLGIYLFHLCSCYGSVSFCRGCPVCNSAAIATSLGEPGTQPVLTVT